MKGLSLNGGGIRGLLTSVALQAYEDTNWDVIIGTSTGSIIGGLLACGFKPSTITELYYKLSDKAFKKNKFLAGVIKPKYDINVFNEELKKIIGSVKLGDLKTNFMATSYDTISGRPVIFKSYKDEHKELLLADVITASVAAPTYFGGFKLNKWSLVDGGVYANNPSSILIREFERMNWDGTIVNIGTGRSYSSFDSKKWGTAQWLVSGKTPIITVFMDGGHDIVVETSQDKFGYVNYDIDIPYIEMDDLSKMQELEYYGTVLKQRILDDNHKK